MESIVLWSNLSCYLTRQDRQSLHISTSEKTKATEKALAQYTDWIFSHTKNTTIYK